MTAPDAPRSDTPKLTELADSDDQLGWERDKHGRMADAAAPDDAVPTVPADEYLRGL